MGKGAARLHCLRQLASSSEIQHSTVPPCTALTCQNLLRDIRNGYAYRDGGCEWHTFSPMARKRILRNLPPLDEAFQDSLPLPDQESKLVGLLNELRKVAKRLRKKQSVPFYSMRDVGLYFSLPLRTVALAYQALEMEGLVSRIRGSKTMLVGKIIAPRSPVRGVVGIPAWLHALVVSPYSRALHVELEERLRESGFVADIIFFREKEVYDPDFVQRLLHHNLDRVIWHSPHPLANNVLLSLKDHGIPQVTVQSTENPGSLPVPGYLQDWQFAYREMARAWYDVQIRKVIVPNPVYLPSKRALTFFTNTLARQGIEVDLVESNAEALQKRVFAEPNRCTAAVAFLDQQGADTICNEEPVILEEIIKHFRVAFCRGPIRLPYFNHRPAKVDVVRFSAVEVADRIVKDLYNVTATEGVIHTFRANYHAQVALDNQAEVL